MDRVIINGHGWSGSSALIDLLRNTANEDYVLVPGEFDDFRVPGTLRELIETDRIPVSHRKRSFKFVSKLLLRSLVPDNYWHHKFPGQYITQPQAKLSFQIQKIEKKAFSDCLKRSQMNGVSPKQNLHIWYNTLVNHIGGLSPSAKNIIFEQIFLFDDDPSLYDWLEFDKLILFIRSPGKQLRATLESDVLYNHYPWQADFLIGGVGPIATRKYEVFVDTTVKRYGWIVEFLAQIKPSKVCIVNFDSFLYQYKKTMDTLSNFLNVDIIKNSANFDLQMSISRDKIWDRNIPHLQEKIDTAEVAFIDFVERLEENYEVI